MSEFGFNYFLERSELLGEMARPTTLYNFVSPEFNSLYDGLVKAQAAAGVKDNGTRMMIVWRYIMDAMNTLGELYVDDDGSPLSTKEIAKEYGNPTSLAGIKKTFLEFLKNHRDLANSPELREYVSNPENLTAFKRNAGFSSELADGDTEGDLPSSTGSNRRKGADKNSRELTGTGILGNETLRSELRDIVLQLNKDMSVRKAKFTKTGQTHKPLTNDATQNPNQAYAQAIVDALEELSYDKQDITSRLQSRELFEDELDTDAQILAKVPSAIVTALQTQYKDIVDQGGITPDEFKSKIQKLQSKPGITPTISNFLLLLADTVDTFTSMGDSPVEDAPKLGGYDADLIQKYASDPDTLAKLKKYIYNTEQIRIQQLRRLEDLYTKKLIDAAIQNNPKLAGAQDDNEVFVNPLIQQYMVTIQNLQKQLDIEQNESRRAAIEQKIEGIKKNITNARQGTPQEEPEEDEDSPMGYMTEQVKRDNYGCKKLGKFVDRGFKKPVNYAHWLHING